MSVIKWGILGLGNIADQFATDLALVKTGKLSGVASRDINKATIFANKHNAAKAFGSYDELLESDEIDIVYIATPHNSHAELAIAAMKNGKHVLCEKPLALSYADAKAIIAASKQYNKFFMEAFWTRFIPSIIAIKEQIDNGELGTLKYINADFAYYNANLGERLTNKKLGGGALYDIGVYPLFLSYLFLGNPTEIIAKAQFHSTGVDLQTSMILQYENAQSVLHAGLTSASDMKAIISGTLGRVEIDTHWFMTNGFSVIKNDELIHFDYPTLGKGYAHEIIECHECLLNNQIESKLWSHQNALELSILVEQVKENIGLTFE